MKRCGLYVRVSTQEQKNHGLSVDSQIKALRDYCAENSYKEIALYNDAGLSASKSYKKRPALLQMLDDCKSGKLDIVLFTKLDRFFRSVPDYYACVEQMNNIPWRAIWEDYETETSAGIFKVNIMLSVAQAESNRTSERIKAVNEFKRQRGDYVGKAPTGYMLKKKDLIIDEEQREGVTVFFNEYLKTHSVYEAVQKARLHGFKPTRETASRMLRNPAYKGETFGYKCEPYITEAQWDEIQRSIPVITRTKNPNDRVYIFNGICKCGECGGIFNGTTRNLQCGKGKKRYEYYRCVTHQNMNCDNNRSITELKLEKYLLDNIGKLIADYNLTIKTRPAVQIDMEKEVARLEGKLSRIGIRFEDGDISVEEYREKRSQIQSELAELTDKCLERQEAIELPHNWLETYYGLDKEHRKAFWRSIIKRIEISRDSNPLITFI